MRGAAAAAVAIALTLASTAHADVYVEASGGDDLNSCRQPTQVAPGSGPCATLAAGIAASAPGEAVVVGPGIYAEAVTLDSGRALRARAAGALIDATSQPGPAAVEVIGPGSAIFGMAVVSDEVGIAISDGSARLVGNRIAAPDGAPVPGSVGVLVDEGPGPAPTAVTLEHNIVRGFAVGIEVVDTLGAVSLENDVVAGSSSHAVAARDTTVSDGPGDLTITGATLWDSGIRDIELVDTAIDLDSTLTEDGVRTTSSVTAATCEIEFSRGPSTAGPACDAFTTSALPLLRDPDAGDFHLTPGSPMAEAGNPLAPAAGDIDLDGEPRLMDGDGDDIARRDIGADELRDTFAPQTKLTKKPQRKTTDRRLRFRFRASQSGSRFECAMGRKPFAPCPSPYKTKRLKRGRHTFRVRAIDSLGNTDPTPAKHAFKVKRTPK